MITLPSLFLATRALKIVSNITNDYFVEKRPFQLRHAKNLRQVGWWMMIASIVCKLSLTIIVSILAGTWKLNILALMHWPGLFISALCALFSRFIEHGVYLQEEVDLTV